MHNIIIVVHNYIVMTLYILVGALTYFVVFQSEFNIQVPKSSH